MAHFGDNIHVGFRSSGPLGVHLGPAQENPLFGDLGNNLHMQEAVRLSCLCLPLAHQPEVIPRRTQQISLPVFGNDARAHNHYCGFSWIRLVPSRS